MTAQMLALLVLAAAAPALRVPGPLSPRIANYRIQVELDPVKHKLTGHEHLEWHNTLDVPARDLAFHLYMNAFKNEDTVFMRERARGEGRQIQHGQEKHWGWIDVKSIKLGGTDLRPQAHLGSCPEDEPARADCPKDETVMTVPLAHPVAPGGQLDLDIDFEEQLPEVIARAGYHKSFHMVGQWFPKIAVFQAPGRWNAHQYHSNSEFFSDFGEYTVEITVPRAYTVGASGVLSEERAASGDKRTLVYHAEDVGDFAWTADSAYKVGRGKFEDVDITVLYHPGSERNVEREIDTARTSLAFLGDAAFPYPYRTLTIVEPPLGGMDAGGMEYPTLITTAPGFVALKGFHFFEEVIAHEFGHQYWYGMLASNEFEEAWMDEGVNQYVTGLLMAKMFPPERTSLDVAGIEMSYDAENHLGYTTRPDWDPLETYAWRFAPGIYGEVYSKTACALRTLEYYLGHEKMMAALKAYANRWKFKHPRAQDFFDAFSTSTGEDLTWFFKEAFLSSDVLDYEITALESEPRRQPAGLFDKDGKRVEVKPEDAAKKDDKPMFDTDVLVHRRGEFRFPVELAVTFEGGAVERVKWDGREAWKRFSFSRPEQAVSATLDPEHHVLLDANWVNDGIHREPNDAPAQRMRFGLAFLVQNLLQSVGL